jgi:hypothetical protein
MSQKVSAFLLLLLLAPAAAAQVRGPADVTVAVGRLAAVPLTVDGDESDYKVLGTDVDAFREYSPDPKQLRLRLIGYAPGTAYVVVACVKGGKLQPLHTVTVLVTGEGPKPPPPPPPPPPDPAVARVKAAFTASNFTMAAQLAAGYDRCAELAEKDGATAADLHSLCRAALKGAMGGVKIPEAVITALTPELAGLPAATAAPMSAADRQATQATFKRVADLIRAAGGVK